MNYYVRDDELYHYGVLGMRWGVRRYQPYPADSKKGKEIGEASKAKRAAGLQRHYQKAVKKFNKIDTKREAAQQAANKKFAKAEKKSYARIFKSEKKVDKAFDQARSAQYNANRLAIKGEKWYRAMESAFAKSGLEFDPEIKSMGQRYIDMVAENSRTMSAQAFVRQRALAHSAKGSTWEDHKYIKRVDGTYYYPDNYEGGRHISDLEDGGNSKDAESDSKEREKMDLADNDIEKLALEVIRGNFGNGETRKELLGPNYEEIQSRVNQMYREGKVPGVQMSSVSESSVSEGKAAAEAAAKTATAVQSKGGINLDQIYSVYSNSSSKGSDRSRDEKNRKASTSSRGPSTSGPKDRVNTKR